MSNGGEEITVLESPISVKHFIHRGLRAEAARVEELLAGLEESSSLQSFKLAFNSWIMALIFHIEQERLCIAEPLTNSSSLSPNGLTQNLIDITRDALLAQDDDLQMQLMQAVEDVLAVLNEDIGTTSLITRTKQHLFSKVVSLRVVQEDYLDVQEAFIMPLIGQRLDEHQHLSAAKGILIDEMADDPGWVIHWVSNYLTPEERPLLMDLEESFGKPLV